MRLHINITFTRPDEGWHEDDLEALKEDLEDEMRFYGDPHAVVEIVRG